VPGHGGDLPRWQPASSLDEVQAAYDELGQQFRADLYVTRQAGPLLST
jgi:hypothetical protein